VAGNSAGNTLAVGGLACQRVRESSFAQADFGQSMLDSERAVSSEFLDEAGRWLFIAMNTIMRRALNPQRLIVLFLSKKKRPASRSLLPRHQMYGAEDNQALVKKQ
jgi:hypothetical protein